MRYVLIADDHEVTRRGVRELLRDEFRDIDITEAADFTGVFAHLADHPWDCLVLDVTMPGANVLEALAHIRREQPSVPVLLLTAATELEYVVQTMKAGANGLIHKHRASDELLTAVRRVAGGGTYLHAETAAEVAGSLRPHEGLPHERLSSRELEILRLIALGRTVKVIAAELELSDKTVATYLSRIREKTGLATHVDIARYCLQHGLVT